MRLLARLLVTMAMVDWDVNAMFGKVTVLCVLGTVLGRFREIKALSIFLKIDFISSFFYFTSSSRAFTCSLTIFISTRTGSVGIEWKNAQ